MVVAQRDLRLADGRTLRAYDAGGGPAAALVWHHGSPQSGAPLPPLVEAAARRGIRLASYARPSYGGSTPQPGRDVASAAGDVAQLADAFGLERFAVMGARPVAGRMRWPVPRSYPTGSRAWSASPDSRHTRGRPSGSTACSIR